MSAKLMGHVWDLSLPRSERDVLLAMADHADDDGGRVRPSVDHLAWKTDYSERQVQRAIIGLKAKRIIEVVGTDDGGRGNIPEYRLFLHRAPKKRPWNLVRQEKLAGRRKKKGDIVSPIEKDDTASPIQPPEKGDIDDEKGAAVSPFDGVKGDIGDAERVTSGAQKGDIRESSLFNEPSIKEPSGETPSVVVPAPSSVIAGTSPADVPETTSGTATPDVDSALDQDARPSGRRSRPAPKPIPEKQAGPFRDVFRAICKVRRLDPDMLDEDTRANTRRLTSHLCHKGVEESAPVEAWGRQWYADMARQQRCRQSEVAPPTIKQLTTHFGGCIATRDGEVLEVPDTHTLARSPRPGAHQPGKTHTPATPEHRQKALDQLAAIRARSSAPQATP